MRITFSGVFVLLIGSLGCSSESNPWCNSRPLPVENYHWQLTEIDNMPVDPASCDTDAPYFVLNSSDKQATGNSGVNQFNGPYVLCGRALRFGPETMTRSAGPAPLMRQEADLNYALSNTAGWRPFGDNEIDLVSAGGVPLARFSRGAGADMK